MLVSIEKLRKDVSMDTEAQISIDNVYEDEDLEREMTRDEYNEIIQPFVQQLAKLL